MKALLNAMSDYFETVPERLRRRRLLLWVLFIISTIVVSLGVRQIKFDMTLEGWFSDDDPLKVALDEFHAEFGSDDGVYIVYKPADGNVFSEKSLRVVKGIRNDLLNFRKTHENPEDSMLNHIVRINTLVNAPVLKAEDDALISKPLVGATIPGSKEALANIRETASQQENFPLLYFSKDYTYGGIFIETDFGTIPLRQPEVGAKEDSGFDEGFGDTPVMDDEIMTVDESAVSERVKFKPTEMDDYLGLMEEINAVLYKDQYADHLTYYPVGNAPLMDYGVEVMEEMGPMYIGMLLIMIVLFWFLFRSLSAVVWPISVVILSTLWTVGIVAWLGITITTMLMLTVMLILAVGTADAIHILSGYLYFRKRNEDHQQALAHAFKKSALACLLTTITTMIGMLALTLTQIVHIKVFGFMSAFGVGLAFLFTIFWLPLMLDLWAPASRKRDSKETRLAGLGRAIPDFSFYLQRILEGVMPIVERHRYLIIAVFLGIFGTCLYGATQVMVDSNIIEQFKEGTRIRKTYELVDKNMMGTQNLEIFFEMGEANAFQDPEVLKALDRMQARIEDKYDLVVRTSSLADVVKDAYQTLNEDREEMYRIPDNERMLSQTLFMFNNANPEDRRKLVSDDYSKSHVSVQLYNEGSYRYTRMFEQMREDIDRTVQELKQSYPDMTVSITGGLALIMEFSHYITWSQIRSLVMVIAVISIVLIFVFGSMRAGLISIIPNLIPATITFGLLGLLGIALDADTMIIAPVIIGIAVDDTIHFITHYRAEVLIDGDVVRSLTDTIKEVGQAITFTTLILGLGFSIMAFSSHMGTSNMGRFGTLAIFVALLCDLFMLPAMILIFKPRFAKAGELKGVPEAQ